MVRTVIDVGWPVGWPPGVGSVNVRTFGTGSGTAAPRGRGNGAPEGRDGTLEGVSSPTPVENRVSASSVVLLSSLMLLLFTGLLVFTFNRSLVEGTTNQWEQASWLWWLIPAVPGVIAGTILTRRYLARQRRIEALRGPR